MKTIAFAAVLLLAGSAQAQTNLFGNPWEAPRNPAVWTPQPMTPPPVYRPPAPAFNGMSGTQNCVTVPFGGSLVTRCN